MWNEIKVTWKIEAITFIQWTDYKGKYISIYKQRDKFSPLLITDKFSLRAKRIGTYYEISILWEKFYNFNLHYY